MKKLVHDLKIVFPELKSSEIKEVVEKDEAWNKNEGYNMAFSELLTIRQQKKEALDAGMVISTPVKFQHVSTGMYGLKNLPDFSEEELEKAKLAKMAAEEEEELVEEVVGERAFALYAYTAKNEDQISFKAGDEVIVFDRESSDGWWEGMCVDGGTSAGIGFFPSSMVRLNDPM